MAKKEVEQEFKSLHMGTPPVVDPQELAADKLAMEYFDRSEAFDQGACVERVHTLGDERGIAIPATRLEAIAVSANAKAVRMELASRLMRKFKLSNVEAWSLLHEAINRNYRLWKKEYVAGQRPKT